MMTVFDRQLRFDIIQTFPGTTSPFTSLNLVYLRVQGMYIPYFPRPEIRAFFAEHRVLCMEVRPSWPAR
jgi:hypothetical protein